MNARQMTAALQTEAMQVLKAHFGDRVQPDRGLFDDTHATLKFRFALREGEDQQKVLREKFAVVGGYHGLQPTDFDLTVIASSLPCKLVDLKPGTKYPFIVEAPDKRRWKVGAAHFLAARALAAAAAKKEG